jgi:general secretion pathway protein D
MDYNTLLGILMTHGYIAIKNGGAIYVIPSNKAKQTIAPIVKSNKKYAGNELVTEVVKVKHAEAGYLLPILRPLMPQHGYLSVHRPTNQIVITDHYSNVQRIKQIITWLDIKQQKRIKVSPEPKTKSKNK